VHSVAFIIFGQGFEAEVNKDQQYQFQVGVGFCNITLD
jgi:hypothetical protein